MELRWHGHSFVSLVTRQGHRLVIDPYLANGQTRRRLEDFRPDLVLVTHAHADHVGAALEMDAPIVCNYEMAIELERRGARETVGMGTGGFWRRDGLSLWLAPAVHTSTFDETPELRPGGTANGFVVDDGETRFYHAGDTALFSDMRFVVGDLLQPHVAALPVGDRYAMGPAHAAKAVEWLGARIAIPIHFGTVPALTGDPKEFERLVAGRADVVTLPVDGGVVVRGAERGAMLPP